MSHVPDNRPVRAALALLAAYNVIQNLALRESRYVAGNLSVTAGLIVIGRHAELGWDDMGLGDGDHRSGVRIGITITIPALLVAILASRIPAIRHRLRDERVVVGSLPAALRRAMIRFPLGTALFEEVAFRGVLPPLLSSGGSERRGDFASAAVFAAWHLLPTHHALAVNQLGGSRLARLSGTLLGAMAAGMSGYALSRLRRRTGSLLAPWLVHGSLNASSYLAVVLSRRRAGEK